MNTRIKKAVESLGLTGETVFTLGDLEKISEMANCKLIDTMRYLRNRKGVKKNDR